MNDIRLVSKKIQLARGIGSNQGVDCKRGLKSGKAFSTPKLPKLKLEILSPKFACSKKSVRRVNCFRMSVLGPLPPLTIRSKYRDLVNESPINMNENQENELFEGFEYLIKEVN